MSFPTPEQKEVVQIQKEFVQIQKESTDSSIDTSNVMSICEKNSNFLGWKFPVSDETRQKILNLFASDFGHIVPTNLFLLTLSYTCESWKWTGPERSSFVAFIGQAEGACGYNPLDDTYVFKSSYLNNEPCHVFNKLTSTEISDFTNEMSCSCLDFDLFGNYYIAAVFENKLCKYSKDHEEVWMKDYSGPVSVAYRRTDELLYTCPKHGAIQVLNPKDGSLIKSLQLPKDRPFGQQHPMKFIPMEVNGVLEEVLLIHEEITSEQKYESYGYCYLVTNNSLEFVYKFVFPFRGYGNYIYDSSNEKLLVSGCNTTTWLEYTFNM